MTTRNLMRRCYPWLSVLLLILSGGSDVLAVENERMLTVAATSLAGPVNTAAAEEFARRISFRPGLTADAVDGTVWYRAPPGVEAPNHVNLLQVKYGRRHDYLAFLLDKEARTFACVARVPALEQEGHNKWFSASPGDNEILHNAPVDRVAEFAYQLRRPAAPRPVIQVEVKAWEQTQANNDGEIVTGAVETHENDLKQLLPLVVASAWDAGYQPTLATNTARLSFSFSKRVDGFDVLVTLTQGEKSVTRRHYGMQMENIYDELGLLCRQMGTWAGQVKAFGRLHPAVVPLASTSRDQMMATEDVLICRANGYLVAMGNCSIEPVWQIPAGGAAARTRMNFAIPEGTPDSLIGFSRASIIRVDASKGEHSVLAQPGSNDRFSWAVEGTQCAIRRETHLHYYQDGEETWSVDCGDPLSGSPALNKDAAFATSTSGRLYSFDRNDGKQRWLANLGATCKGILTTLGDAVYANDTTGTLHCIGAKEGKVRWSLSVGDLLLQPPRLVAGSLLVATRKNQILVLDPATGNVMHSRQWPTWLRSVTPLMVEETQRLFAIDSRHQLQVLSWPELETQLNMTFPFPLKSPPLVIKDFGVSWRGPDNLERAATILVTDEKGHLFLLDPNALERGAQ